MHAPLEDLIAWGYHLVPWQRTPRKPLVKDWLSTKPNAAGFLRAYGTDIDWAIVPTFACVLDIEVKNGLDGRSEMLQFMSEESMLGPVTKTKSGGRHLWFRQPSEPLIGGHHITPGIEAKALTGSVHIAPSVGYESLSPLVAPDCLPPMPQALVDAWRKSATVRRQPITYAVEAYAMGERRARMCSMAGRLRSAGLTEPELVASLMAVRDTRCEDPSTFTDAEVIGIAKDYAKRPERTEPSESWLPPKQYSV
jgi:hypothetical protein